MIGSLVLCGYGFGSLIWIPVQTNFVNPANTAATQDPICDENKVQSIKSPHFLREWHFQLFKCVEMPNLSSFLKIKCYNIHFC